MLVLTYNLVCCVDCVLVKLNSYYFGGNLFINVDVRTVYSVFNVRLCGQNV